jgi:hypothetical protein
VDLHDIGNERGTDQAQDRNKHSKTIKARRVGRALMMPCAGMRSSAPEHIPVIDCEHSIQP